MARHGLTDEQWALIEDLFPRNGTRPGRPWKDHCRKVSLDARADEPLSAVMQPGPADIPSRSETGLALAWRSLRATIRGWPKVRLLGGSDRTRQEKDGEGGRPCGRRESRARF